MKVLLILLILVETTLASKHIPLRRVKSLRHTMKANGQWEDYIKLKQKLTMSATEGSESLKDYVDTEYLGEVDIGTPSQTFLMAMDTGSANLYVESSSCNSQITCGNKTGYNSSQSSTYTPNGKKIIIASCNGILDNDKVCIAGICVNDQPFAECTNWLGNIYVDGVCGLAFQALAVDRILPPVQNMIQQNMLDNPWFTVWMKADGNVQGADGGQITLGDYDTTHCSASCDWVPLTSATFFEFTLDGYRVASSGTTFSKVNPRGIGSRNPRAATASQAAISDTSSSLITGPSEDIDTICKALGGKADGTLYTIACDATPPDVIFTINGKDYPVTHKNYIVPDGAGICILGFQGMHTIAGPKWTLGDCFIREYCNVYDLGNKRLGICKATA